jgi:hypothetical protein
MTFKPGTWVFYAPIALLPLLAALVIGSDSVRSGSWDAVYNNWFWLLVSIGLGIWVGWTTSANKGAP